MGSMRSVHGEGKWASGDRRDGVKWASACRCSAMNKARLTGFPASSNMLSSPWVKDYLQDLGD